MSVPDVSDGPRSPRRRRDPEGHRRAILLAAREALAERGYTGTTIREVARRAGVTHGLVMRHFGSKEQLMRAALPDPPGLIEILAEGVDPATLPERIAHTFVARMDDDARVSPLVGILRATASNERAAGEMYAEMRRRSAAALREVCDGDDLDTRADLVAAVLIGVAFERYIVRAGSLATMAPARLETHLAGILRHVLGPVLPAGRPESRPDAIARGRAGEPSQPQG